MLATPQPPIESNKPALKRRRWHRIFFAVIALAALVSLALFASSALWIPYAIKTYAPSWLKEKTGRVLTVGDATFNPFTLQLNITKLALNDAARPLAAFDQLHVKGSWESITNAAWTLDAITLTKPQINAHIAEDGSLDWERFVSAFPKTNEPERKNESVPRIVLKNIAVTEGAVVLTDERVGVSKAAQKRIELAPLTFKLDRLSTLPRDRGEYALNATLNDQTRVQWKGRVGANPIESSGDLSISNLPLARLSTLANTPLPVELTGTAALQANYTIAAGTDFFAAGVGGGTLSVSDLNVAQNGDTATVKSLLVSPLSFSYAKSSVANTRDAGAASAAVSAAASATTQTVFAIEPLKIALDEARVFAKNGNEAVVSFNKLHTPTPMEISVSEKKVLFPKVALNNLIARINRALDGSFVSPFAQPTTATAAEKTIADAAPRVASAQVSAAAKDASSVAHPWRIEIGEFASDDARVTFNDASFSTPQTFDTKAALTFGASVELVSPPKIKVATQRATLSDIAARDRDAVSQTPWLTVKEIRMQPLIFASDAARIDIPKIDIVSPQLSANYSRAGVDIAKKFSPANASPPIAAPAAPAAAAQPGKATPISLAGISLTGGRVEFTDATLATPISHVLQEIRIATERIAVNGAQPINASINATLASGGALQSKLKFDATRGDGAVEFSLDKLVLAAFSPYLNRNTKLKLTKGEAALSGALNFATRADADESFRFEGKAALRDVDLIDETTDASFAAWSELSTNDARVVANVRGMQIALADLLLDQPRGKIIIGEDRRVNLTQIEKLDASGAPIQPSDQPAANAAPAPQDAAKKTQVNVSRIQVAGADIEFADLSLRPQFGTRISDLSGLIVGLSTDVATRAEVSMEGKVDQFGLARLTGTIAPFGATEFTDLKATFRNLEMANLTPYSGKFAGRKIESGKLSLNLEYKIEARKLKGENQVIIDNIKLGERVDSPEATSLPLDLAIALMRDSNGVIDLGIPVQGSLDDPQFTYGSLIWKAIVNVLTKVATAPFRALGALLGGSGDEFEAVIFEAGEARLLPPEREKLAKLAKALEQRPQLKLNIAPGFDRAADRDALADNIVKLEIGKRAGMKPPGPNEPLIVSFTDPKVQTALDELASAAGDDAVKLRAKYLPPASNAITGMIQNARERVTEKGRNESAEARGKYYPELFALLKSKQSVPEFAFEALASLRGQAIQNTLTGVNKFDAARVSVAAPSAAKDVKDGRVPTQLALSVK